MTYKGHVEDGVIVPDEPIDIENGVSVLFEIRVNASDQACSEFATAKPSITQLLSRFAGKALTLPGDAAENLDHYLYGLPKQ